MTITSNYTFINSDSINVPFTCESIFVSDVRMERASGYGHYYMVVECDVDGERKTLKRLTSSSPLWDAYKSTDDTDENCELLMTGICQDVLDAYEELNVITE
jgi:hypothetical protein